MGLNTDTTIILERGASYEGESNKDEIYGWIFNSF